MQATTQALDHVLRAVGDPVAELCDIGPGHPEFDQAQTIRAAAGVLAKIPDTMLRRLQSILQRMCLFVTPWLLSDVVASRL